MNIIEALSASPLGQTAQAASNAIAQNISGPVDLFGFALRKLGLPVPEDAVGSSQWMAQKGLTKPVDNAIARVTGETLGMVGPTLATAYAPQVANALNRVPSLAREYVETRIGAPGGASPATVWHGSPHKFDKFDSSKIGTGEGAQAYGHGLYLGGTPETGDFYRKKLQGGPLGVDVQNAVQRALGTDYDEAASSSAFLDGVRQAAGSGPEAVRAAIIKVAKRMAESQWPGEQRLARRVRALADNSKVVEAIDTEAAGNLYKVDLPDEAIARMLDWDKPLSQQPGMVQKVFDNAWQHSLYRKRTGVDVGDFKGADLVNAMGADGHSRALFADDMRKAGIPGIRYLDGGSRSAGAGTSNYVVFPGEEKALTILERNGIPVREILGQ